ncbi:MAG: hypothetical protein ACR2QL_06670 [Woeseiaceae bacterium]
MNNRHWRELVEIVGVVAIVASLILVASELRQSNRIAAAQTEQHIGENFNTLNIARATDPEFAKLFPKLEAPESHLITATDASQIRGIARHLESVYWTVHSAYENGLISREIRDSYSSDLAQTLEQWPGIRSDFIDMYLKHDWMRESAVYKPIAEYIPSQATDSAVETTE